VCGKPFSQEWLAYPDTRAHAMAGELRSKVVVATLIIDPQIEAKIREKHKLTAAEVKEAVIYARDAQAEWEDHPDYGRRLVVQGTTYRGRPVIAYLVPLDESDEEEGGFRLRTALSLGRRRR
jgi:hypothetical protein